MAKFNLKTYEKISGDEHIEKRLRNEHTDAPNEINESQLETYRSPEPQVLIEKQLEKNRSGEADEVTEKRLDTKKADFNIEFRNPEAYKGDMNKLEEKRLLNDPVEDEKYVDVSEVPKAFRWWEEKGSPDKLLLAKKDVKKNVKQAQIEELSFDSPEDHKWKDIEDPENLDDNFDSPLKEEVFPEQSFIHTDMEIVKQKNILNPLPNGKYLAGVYMVLNYNPLEFNGNVDEIKEAALNKVLEVRDDLGGLISKADFGNISEVGDIGEISLRATGDKFIPVLMGQEGARGDKGERTIEEINYTGEDIGGTPTVIGELRVGGNIDDEESVIREVLDFINEKHPSINVTEESLDTSGLESEGIIGFMVGSKARKHDFDIEEAEEAESVFAQSNVVKKK